MATQQTFSIDKNQESSHTAASRGNQKLKQQNWLKQTSNSGIKDKQTVERSDFTSQNNGKQF